eukprot:FR742476.1.p1 GENE.FR742476.1~~FR742476.1.p1  ORF type:complete len:217 (+),score=10.03 FR742476.1:25-651(+)
MMRMEWDNNSDFSIEGPKFLRTVKPLKNSKGVDFAQLEVGVFVERGFAPYFWDIYVPLSVITSLVSIVGCYQIFEFEARNTVNMTLLAICVAYKYLLSTFLPRLKYLTQCDVFVHFSFSLLMVVMAECALVYYYFQRADKISDSKQRVLAKAFWKTADSVLLWLTAVLWVLFLIIYALRCRYLYVELREKERQKVMKSKGEFHRLVLR